MPRLPPKLLDRRIQPESGSGLTLTFLPPLATPNGIAVVLTSIQHLFQEERASSDARPFVALVPKQQIVISRRAPLMPRRRSLDELPRLMVLRHDTTTRCRPRRAAHPPHLAFAGSTKSSQQMAPLAAEVIERIQARASFRSDERDEDCAWDRRHNRAVNMTAPSNLTTVRQFSYRCRSSSSWRSRRSHPS